MDEDPRDRPLPFFGWLRNLAGERIVDMHRAPLDPVRRSINRESRIPDLCDDSADVFARSFIAQDTSPSNRLLQKEQLEQVMGALAELSPRDREVLVMRHLEQLSPAEIADAPGISEGAVNARHLRAVIRLRSKLEASP